MFGCTLLWCSLNLIFRCYGASQQIVTRKRLNILYPIQNNILFKIYQVTKLVWARCLQNSTWLAIKLWALTGYFNHYSRLSEHSSYLITLLPESPLFNNNTIADCPREWRVADYAVPLWSGVLIFDRFSTQHKMKVREK